MTKFLINTFAMLTIVSTTVSVAETQTNTSVIDAQTHLEVVDALVRFTNGIDTDNGELIASAFTKNGKADFTPAAKKVGMEFPVLSGRETIVSAMVPFASNFVTSHTVSNANAIQNGNKVSLYALVEAQHFQNADASKNFLMKNQYWMDVVQEDGMWRIEAMTIENLWTQGQLSVMTGE